MKEMPLKLTVPIAIISVVLLLVANTSIWLNRSIFNRQSFSSLAVTALQKEESRKAISREIVDRAFSNQPLIKEVGGKILIPVISAVLDTDISKTIIQTAAKGINIIITSKKEAKEVSIKIDQIKSFIEPLAEAVNKKFNLNIKNSDLPDKLTILKQGQIPSIYNVGIVLLWLGPFAGIIGIGLIIALIWIADPKRRSSVLKTLGAALGIGSVIFIILIYLIKAPILAGITNENMQILAGNIYGVFTGILIRQTWFLLIGGIAFILSGFYFSQLLNFFKIKK